MARRSQEVMIELSKTLVASDMKRKGTLWKFPPKIEARQQHVEVGKHHHMNSITIIDKVDSESNDESVIMNFQYLQINNNKVVKTGKLNKDSVLLDTYSTC